MAGFKESFGENLNFAYQSGRGRGRDLTGALQSGVAGLSSIRGMAAAAKDAQKELGRLKQRANDLEAIRQKTAPASKAFAELTYRINETNSAIEKMKKNARSMGFEMLEKSLGGLTKKLITFNTTLLGLGFDFLIESITRVYQLQERWTKAIGGFNMKLGGLTKGMNELTKTSMKWSSTMRGLTNGDIDLDFFADFTLAMGGTTKSAQEMADVGLVLARGFNLQADGAAKLTTSFTAMGSTQDDLVKVMGGDLVSATDQMGVSLNQVAKDLSEASTYMTRFGKEGQKTFVQGAAYSRKFFISMKQLQGAVEGFDMFDDAAKTASKLNTAFGTMVNSMDLMMEDDPAKRLEMIRQQFLAQGKTFDTLKPKQVRYLSETLKLNEDQVASLLDVKNANVSYSDFKAKEALKEKKEVDAKRNMEIMLRKTTQTMYAFGAAFDRITVAIANAIKPLLKVFGLAGDGNKKFKSFGQVMESVTKTVEEFFNSLPSDERWTGFMQTLAVDLTKAGSALKDFVMSGRAATLVGDLADTMKSFYVWVRDLGTKALPYIDKMGHAFLFLAKNVKYLAAAWVGMKGVSTLGGPTGFMGGIGKLGGAGKGLLGMANTSIKGQAGLGMGGRLAGAGLGLGVGSMLGGTGAELGGAIGGLAGPLGGMLGAAFGKAMEHLYDYFTKDDELEESRKDMVDAQERAAAAAQKLSVFQEKSSLLLRQSDLERARGDKALAQLQKGKQLFEIQDKNQLIERVKQLQGFGKNTELTSQALQHLTTDGKLSKEMLSALKEAGMAYNVELNSLKTQTEDFVKLQQEKMGFESDEIKQAMLKNREAAADLEISELKRQRAKLQGTVDPMNMIGDSAKLEKLATFDKKIREAELNKNDIIIAKETQQAKTLDKQLALDMKRFQLETMNRDSGFMKFMADSKTNGLGNLGENELAKQYLMSHPEMAQSLAAQMGGADMYKKVAFGMAGGGVVSRPTYAMIGEAGPEAVIPLRSMARGRMGAPARHGGQAATDMVNYASGGKGGSSGGQVVSSMAEIKLDGHSVGRALVRTLITSR